MRGNAATGWSMLLGGLVLAVVISIGLYRWDASARAAEASLRPQPVAPLAAASPIPLAASAAAVQATAVPAGAQAAGLPPPASGDAAAGVPVFQAGCNGCHPNANAGVGPALHGPAFMDRYPDNAVLSAVIRSGRGGMPAFGPDKLGDPDLANLVAYLRSLSAAPEAAAAGAPTAPATSAPIAPTQVAAAAPTAVPTSAPTAAAPSAPTAPATSAPIVAPTQVAAAAPTAAATSAPTAPAASAPTTAAPSAPTAAAPSAPTAAAATSPPAAPNAPDAAAGQTAFQASCNACHPNANAGVGPALHGQAFDDRYSDDAAVAAVIRSGRGGMPAFGPDKLSDPDLANIIAYLRSSS